MRKRRSDSPWNQLTSEQNRQMDTWYFEESLSGQEILERARKEFKIEASRQTLTAYFRHRQEKRALAVNGRWSADEAEHLLAQRSGAGMSLEDLEARTVYCTALAAYEMSLAQPGSLQVKELRSLMKLLNEHQLLAMEQRTRTERSNLQHVLTAVKACRSRGRMLNKQDFEKMVSETDDIMRRARQKGAEEREPASEWDEEKDENENKEENRSATQAATDPGKATASPKDVSQGAKGASL